MIDAALLLPQIMARAGDNAELNETAATIAWRRIVGEGLRAHAVPSRLEEKTLIISVADAVWQKQLQMMSSELIFRLNKLLRRKLVERIEFRIDPSAVRPSPTRNESVRRAAAPLPADILSSAAEIHDQELRDRFVRAAVNCIARRNSIESAIRDSQSAI